MGIKAYSRRRYLLFMLLSVCVALLGQTKYIEGLPADYNSFLSQTRDGQIYVSSLEGFSIYNGFELETHRLSNDSGFLGSVVQSAFYEDSNGFVWTTSYEYLIRYDPIDSDFRSVQLIHTDSIDREYHLFYIDTTGRNLYGVADGRVFVYDTVDESYRFFHQKVTSRRFTLRSQMDSLVFIGCPWMDGQGLEVITIDDELTVELILPKVEERTFNSVFSKAICLSDRNILLSDSEIFFLSEDCHSTLQIMRLPESPKITDAVSIGDSLLLISTIDEGLFLLGVRSEELRRVSIPYTLSASPWNINQTENYLWISHVDRGVEYIPVTSITSAPLNMNSGDPKVNGVFECEDHWVHVGDGLMRVYSGLSDSIYLEVDLPDSRIEVVNIDRVDSDIFLSGTREVWKWNAISKKWKSVYHSGSEYILDMVAQESFVYTITNQRLVKSNHVVDNSVNIVLDSNVVDYNKLFKTKSGDLWSSSSRNEIRNLSLSEVLIKLKSEVTQFIETGIGGWYLIGTKSGLYKSDGASVVPLFTEAWEVGEREIVDIHFNGPDEYVVITRNEVFVVSNNLTQISLIDILINISYDPFGNTSYVKNNILSIVSPGGLIDIRIDDFRGFDSDYAMLIKKKKYDKNLRLLNEGDRVFAGGTFEYTLTQPNYNTNNSGFIYSVGHDQGDIAYVRNGASIKFENYAAGTYDVNVQSVVLGRINSNMTSFSFTIWPPYYQTWWFRIGVALGLLGSGWGINYFITRKKLKKVRDRLKQQKLLSDQREKIADDLHDELGTELSKILYLSDEAATQPISVRKDELLVDITELAGNAISSMRDMLWVLEEKKDSLGEVLLRIRSNINRSLSDYPIRVEYRFDESQHDLYIHRLRRQHLLLIFKEAVHNIIKHSHATDVEVGAKVSSEVLSLWIRDNGIGLEQSSSTLQGRGMQTMMRRSKSINGTLEIKSLDNGTYISITLPLTAFSSSSNPIS